MSVEELALLVAACPAFKLADLDGSQPQPAAVVLPTVGEATAAYAKVTSSTLTPARPSALSTRK